VAQEQNHQDWLDIHEGDADVWREFLTRQIQQLYGMFMKRWPNPSLVEELVQKTVFDAVRGRKSFDQSKGTAEEWIFGIARNNIRLEIRKRASRGSINGDISRYLETIDNKPLPDEVLEQKETVAVVKAALNNLENKEQAVLRAKYIDGLSANKIAHQMGVTEKAVHSLLYRARISLREKIRKIAPICGELASPEHSRRVEPKPE
jgi:RNA polymerase sigma factor (sigma-70 family)